MLALTKVYSFALQVLSSRECPWAVCDKCFSRHRYHRPYQLVPTTFIFTFQPASCHHTVCPSPSSSQQASHCCWCSVSWQVNHFPSLCDFTSGPYPAVLYARCQFGALDGFRGIWQNQDIVDQQNFRSDQQVPAETHHEAGWKSCRYVRGSIVVDTACYCTSRMRASKLLVLYCLELPPC